MKNKFQVYPMADEVVKMEMNNSSNYDWKSWYLWLFPGTVPSILQVWDHLIFT